MIAAFFLRSDAIPTSSGAINYLARSRACSSRQETTMAQLPSVGAGNVEARVRCPSLARSFSWLHRVT
jgi:hypothetical protein